MIDVAKEDINNVQLIDNENLDEESINQDKLEKINEVYYYKNAFKSYVDNIGKKQYKVSIDSNIINGQIEIVRFDDTPATEFPLDENNQYTVQIDTKIKVQSIPTNGHLPQAVSYYYYDDDGNTIGKTNTTVDPIYTFEMPRHDIIISGTFMDADHEKITKI